MSDLSLSIEMFHFIRPWLLIALLLIGLLWWQVRRSRGQGKLTEAKIAAHLAKAMTVGQSDRERIMPIDGVAAVLILACLGAAGPTWSRVPDPFVAQTAPLVIALQVTPSMKSADLAPSRLERAKQKIRDLLALRAGARSALVAYAGMPHAVVPMTEDPNVVQPYLEGLQVDVMPRQGNAAGKALELAHAILERESAPGGILMVSDDIAQSDVAALNDTQGTSLAVLAMLPEGVGSRGIDQLTIPVQQVSVDDADIVALDRLLSAAYRRALAEKSDQPWDDRGWLLAWPAALLGLFWFRRGWTMRWGVAVVAMAMLNSTHARADGLADWFLTRDQQGQIAFDKHHFDKAGALFAEPMHKAYALYRDGKYAGVVETVAALETAEASFLAGMAHIKSRGYRDAIADFQTTLKRDPDFPGARQNLEIAKKILAYVESAREQSDTGEHTGEGADDVVFDNKEAKGADTEIKERDEGPHLLTADQWMNTVDTNTADFLRQRFAMEAAKR